STKINLVPLGTIPIAKLPNLANKQHTLYFYHKLFKNIYEQLWKYRCTNIPHIRNRNPNVSGPNNLPTTQVQPYPIMNIIQNKYNKWLPNFIQRNIPVT